MKNTSRWRLTRYLAASLIACQIPALATAEQPVAEQEILLAVVVNDRKLTDATLILRTAANGIIVPSQLLTEARLRLPTTAAISSHQENYYPLDALPGVRAEIDSSTQTLLIHAPAAAFTDSEFDLGEYRQLLEQASETGAFLNYDINYAKGQGQNNLSAVTEVGVFSGGGTYTSRFVGQDLTGARSVFRLDSQYTRDFPQQQATLVVGDSVTGSSSFSRQVYFGGLQWHTKFSTIPGYQPIPLPAFSGTAAAPSVVDIYVDNVLRLKQPVDTGPFTINNLPVYAGQGNVQMVVHDVLGRQQVYTQSYITSAQLLRQGSKDVSYEVGALRNNFGSKDSDYGQVFSSATVRYGISDSSTLETHGEVMRGRESLAIGGAFALKDIGMVSGGVAASNSERGNDTQQYLQFDRQGSGYALTLRAQTAGARFWQLGLGDDILAPAQQIQAQTNFAIGKSTNLAFGYLSQVNRGQDNIRAVNAGLNFNLRRYGTISVGLLKSLTQDRPLSANVVWVIPLEHQSFVQLVANGQPGSKSFSAEYQQAAPQEGGWGYRARKSLFDNGGEDVGVNYLGTTGEYTMSANHVDSQSNLQLEARGGIALLGGHARATRWMDDSFAMVEVPVSQPIDIYANNIKVGHTDKDGVGFIPRLVAYEPNNVYLDTAGLPLSMTLDLNQKSVTPGPRTGSLLKFSAQQNQSATLVLRDRQGAPLATGTRVYLNGAAEAQEVALRGQVFIPAMTYPAKIAVTDNTGQAICSFGIPIPARIEAFPMLGPFACDREMK
ncbi:fimbria/pilus outer membrane usher protein [Collimonas pratensis]|uniref:fimbria/pilus outer membrane usher protein n=1 Tax=Collimonas pratensis TaxID=279113 RepID=UPI0009EEE7BB|nr:fimbria/pilus outer membrane usher protein [Collimonas pratensis]